MRVSVKACREKLYSDPELGAGNVLFKALAAYSDRENPFLFLENSFVSPQGTVYPDFSLATLYRVVVELSTWYAGSQVKAGDFVCLYLREGVCGFLHFLALNAIGAIPVLINGNLPPETAVRYAMLNGFAILTYDDVTDRDARISGKLSLIKGINASVPVMDKVDEVLGDWPVARGGDDIVMICHSSGTTGMPKAVSFTHDQFFRGKRERLQSFIEAEVERMVTIMPTSHAAGISYLMTAVLLQIPTLSLTQQRGKEVADAIAAYAPSIVTAFPQTYVSLVRLGLPDGHLNSVRRFYNTGDTSHEAHIRELLRVAPKARYIDMFGASELGMSQFYKTSSPGMIASGRCVGRAADYAECVILSPTGAMLPDGEPGYIGVKSPTITPGYYGQPHMTELSRLNGYWLTGDVGIRNEDGEFIHLDRIIDVVNTAWGKKAYTLLIEEHVLRMPEVVDVTVVGVQRGPTSEQAVVIFVTPKEQFVRLTSSEVLRHIVGVLPCLQEPIPDYGVCAAILVPDYELPTGASGKVLKSVVKELFWTLQREYWQGDRSKIQEACWNHNINTSPVESVGSVAEARPGGRHGTTTA